MFGGGSVGGYSTNLNSLRVNSSCYGRPIPVTYGCTRVNPLIIWAANFKRHAGKFFGLGPSTYSTGADFLLSHNPLLNILTIWLQGGSTAGTQRYGWYLGTQDVTIQHTLGDDYDFAVVTNAPAGAQLVNFLGAQVLGLPYNQTFNDYGAPAPFTLSGTSQINVINQDTIVGPVYANENITPLLRTGYPYPYTWFNSPDSQEMLTGWTMYFQPGATPPYGSDGYSTALIGLTVRIWYAYAAPLSWTPDARPLQGITFGQFEQILGSGTEYSDNGFTSQQVEHTDCCGIGFSDLSLGVDGNLPNLSFEQTSLYPFNPATGDGLPSDFVQDLIGSGAPTYHGANVGAIYNLSNSLASTAAPISFIENIQPMMDFCMAYRIYLSNNLTAQKKCNEYLEEILKCANTAAVWSGFQLKLIPRCEVSNVGDNAAVYTAGSAGGPIYDLGYNQYLFEAGKGISPIEVDRKRPSDAFNIVRVQFKDRSIDYNTNVVTAVNQGNLQNYGPRPAPVETLDWIQDAETAMKVATMILQRYSSLNNYKFSGPLTLSLLEPLDMITLSDPRINLQRIPARLTKVREAHDKIMFEAEDFVYGRNCPTPIATAPTNPNAVYGSTDPGNVNVPIIFVPPPALVNGDAQTPYVGFAVSGADTAAWGGCYVYMSINGGPFNQVGVITGPAIMGLTLADFPTIAGAAPVLDTADTLNCDFTESAGVIATVNATEFAAYVTATLIGSPTGTPPYELIAWENASQITGNQYAIAPNTWRGIYASPIGDHPIGSPVALLTQNILYLALNPSLIGQSLAFKFTSFNLLQNSVQDITMVTQYNFVPYNY
jgi:hypothetical protein